jgi:glycine dehydrogenase subunit 1
MRYTPHTAADIEAMLRVIGADSVEALYAHIPASLRQRARIGLAPGKSELEVQRRLAALAARNAVPGAWRFFLGGGIYHHFIPSTVDAVISRGEFSTAYTPYQPEVSQGTLQAIYEFQSLMCQLTAMEVSNAGLYDGASAAAEAVLMARRIEERRPRVLVSRALHPHYREVIATYLRNLPDAELVEIPFDADGATDVSAAARALDGRALCAVVGYPNFFGVIEDLAPIRELCSRHGALLITVTAEALSFAALRPPGECGADIAVGEGQSLGVPMSFGGPGFGFFTCRKRFVRNMPGRLVGETVDSRGGRGFVLTLSTREQHIRREKATSNICTNQNLCNLAATVFMATLGRRGLRSLADANIARAHAARARLTGEGGLEPLFAAPFFNEFTLRVPRLAEALERCYAARLVPGLPLARWYPELADGLLVCVTEMNEPEEIDALVRELSPR